MVAGSCFLAPTDLLRMRPGVWHCTVTWLRDTVESGGSSTVEGSAEWQSTTDGCMVVGNVTRTTLGKGRPVFSIGV